MYLRSTPCTAGELKGRLIIHRRSVKRRDPLTPAQRSERMARVKGRGNRSTEVRIAAALAGAAIRGWRRHPQHVLGRPDFWFPAERVVVFVDGCFWHGCPTCARRLPVS